MVRLGMQIANVKLRQILPRVGNQIWVRTPQNREEIRRNPQKSTETPYQYAETPKQTPQAKTPQAKTLAPTGKLYSRS